MSKTILVGIVAYDGLDGQVAEDYMRLMFHLGRRCPEYEFQLAIKWKSEQFRARNAIVSAGLQFGADYIWMLDDDHIFDTGSKRMPSSAYDLPIKLAKHLEDNEKIGVVGALYYQRGAECYPVIMQEMNGKPFFLQHREVSARMQKVDVTGGGCMMIRASIFDKIEQPWFKPEHQFGTDIQLCRRARDAGYEVWCDTSLEIGHLQKEKVLITGSNAMELSSGEYEPFVKYQNDVQEYLQMGESEIYELAATYDNNEFTKHDDPIEYYATRGNAQLARQMCFHKFPIIIEQQKLFHSLIDCKRPGYGADFGCGSAPVGFHFAQLGHKMDFVDIEGSAALDFTKWRAGKYSIDCGFELKGPYDYVLMLDALEHIVDWQEALDSIISSLKVGGAIITNYFSNGDFDNPEHVSMDHVKVMDYLMVRGLTKASEFFWVKRAEEKVA